ncbi:MAG: adenylyl-sulfate kinase [Chloroflexi bacterium]|nr:adenylyl-sulfate kinase [Chloroflexota bacterium]
MGLFHCPMGAAFYEDDDCIDCGMCYAKTKDEMIEASKRIRTYLKAHALKNSTVKKIAVCGKGGVGKSTIVTLLANALREAGYSVLVFDTDESNPGLYRMFGFDKQPRALMTVLSRLPSGKREVSAKWLTPDQITVADIPSEYILGGDGFKFLMVGKIEDPFQGCACSMANIAGDFVGKLVVQDKELVLIDIEAGIESFGRGVERNVDMVLIVVEPSFESMALAEKITYMAEGMGISRVRAILNKVPSDKVRQRMAEELDRKGVKTLGAIYFDPELSEAGFEGAIPANSKATEEMKAIAELLLGESK